MIMKEFEFRVPEWAEKRVHWQNYVIKPEHRKRILFQIKQTTNYLEKDISRKIRIYMWPFRFSKPSLQDVWTINRILNLTLNKFEKTICDFIVKSNKFCYVKTWKYKLYLYSFLQASFNSCKLKLSRWFYHYHS